MPYRVLLVDDEIWALKDMEISFPWARYGFSVMGSYQRPQEAFDALLALRPDVVVTDVCMPVLTGDRLLAKARQHGIGSIFVIVSGVSDFKAAQTAIHYGAAEYILKPLDAEKCEQLLIKLSGMLDKTDQKPADRESVAEITQYIAANLGRNLPLQAVAAHFHISANTLLRIFSKKLGTSFVQYVEEQRLSCARHLLMDDRLTVQRVSEIIGYTDASYFGSLFKRKYGVTPMQFRKAGGEERL